MMEDDIYEQLLAESLQIERNVASQSAYDEGIILLQDSFSNEKIEHVDVCDVDTESFYSPVAPSFYITITSILILILLISLIWKLIRKKRNIRNPVMIAVLNFESWEESVNNYQKIDVTNLVWTNQEKLMTKLDYLVRIIFVFICPLLDGTRSTLVWSGKLDRFYESVVQLETSICDLIGECDDRDGQRFGLIAVKCYDDDENDRIALVLDSLRKVLDRVRQAKTTLQILRDLRERVKRDLVWAYTNSMVGVLKFPSLLTLPSSLPAAWGNDLRHCHV